MNSTIKPSACKTCGSPYHSAMYHKPRKPIETTKPLPRAKKPISQGGKVRNKWAATKAQWFETHSAYTPCHYCGIGLKPETITLDHKTSRSRAPELRYDFNNLVPCCYHCNGLKGSVDHDNYKHDCPDGKKEAV